MTSHIALFTLKNTLSQFKDSLMKKPTQILSILLLTALLILGCKKENPVEPIEVPIVKAKFTDPRDGQKYDTVRIGNQVWFAENLRYSGAIPQVTDDFSWAMSSQPAWCYYDNDSTKDAVHGKLYNWFAVDAGNLCPNGWHIPTDDDWTILGNFLGGDSIAGGKLKSTTNWQSPNSDATNSTNFSAFGSGARTIIGTFGEFNRTGHFWSSTLSGFEPWSRRLNYYSGNLERKEYAQYGGSISAGMSCRCLMD